LRYGRCTKNTESPQVSSTLSLSDNRISVGLSPAIKDWLYYESKMLGVSIPCLIRDKLAALWKIRQPLVREPEKPGRTQ
jgi:hypothetical protein